MDIIELHTSADGLLKFVVCRDAGVICLGFVGFGWHTHPELLAGDGVSEDAAVRQFVDELLAGRVVIAVAHVGGAVRDVWVTDDIESDLKYKQDDVTIEHRYWDGSKAAYALQRLPQTD